MAPVRRRGRTGCLTCRARRLKCDERKPTCERCEVANYDCAGYEEKRQAPVLKKPATRDRKAHGHINNGHTKSPAGDTAQSHSSLSPSSQNGTPTSQPASSIIGASSFSPASDRPLVAFPSNPRPFQRPGRGARHVLGYQQLLLRTLPMLFPADDLYFWRDELCQEAWGSDYLYLTLTALGCLHRSVLICYQSGGVCDNKSGLDIKITAVQIYTQALQELSSHIEEAKATPRLLVGVLCLMAYFESFSANIPACMGHVQVASHYYSSLVFGNAQAYARGLSSKRGLEPLERCLRVLGQSCRIAVAFPCLIAVAPWQIAQSPSSANSPSLLRQVDGTVLQTLVNLVYADADMEELIWRPLVAHNQTVPASDVHRFINRLLEWRNDYIHILPELNSDLEFESMNQAGKIEDQLEMPPPPYSSVGAAASLAAAHFNFYMGRMKWALCLLGEHSAANQVSANFYYHQALRFVSGHTNTRANIDEPGDYYIPCDSLKIGFLPLLHIIGQCSPRPSWLQWVSKTCEHINQEGMLKGHTFSTNLACLQTFELFSSGASLTVSDAFPDPKDRVICQLIPEPTGNHFISYFAKPRASAKTHDLNGYEILGHARWECFFGVRPCNPKIELYASEDMAGSSFTKDWLLSRQVATDWTNWSAKRVEFDMDRALRDHIDGTVMLPQPDEMNTLPL